MSGAVTASVAHRVLRQLRRDPRTIALMLVMPVVLLLLLRYVFDGRQQVFDAIVGPLVGMLPFIVMFLVTSIAMLRERTSGTLERLMSMPIAKLELLAGYGVAFGVMATLQALIASWVVFGVLDVQIGGTVGAVLVLAVANAVLGMSLGLLASAFARTEFQAVQFMPAFVFPQMLLCGLFAPRDQMAGVLEAISRVLPLTWAFDGLQRVVVAGDSLGHVDVLRDLAIVVAFTVGSLLLAALTLRRRTA